VFAQLHVDENEGGYPDAHQFSVNGLPAYGFYIRNANRITIENANIKSAANEARPLFVGTGYVSQVVANGKPVPLQSIIDFTYEPKLIKNVAAVGNEKVQASVKAYRIGDKLYTDRSNRILKVDDPLNGAEFIQWPMDLRSSVSEALVSFDVLKPCVLYVAHSSVYTPQDWLVNGFEKVIGNDGFKLDKWSYNLYKKVVAEPVTVVLGGNHKGVLPVQKGENYIVFVVESK
jgi:hypothetical protein